MATHWWHHDRTGDKEQVAKKGNLNAMDQRNIEQSKGIGEPAGGEEISIKESSENSASETQIQDGEN